MEIGALAAAAAARELNNMPARVCSRTMHMTMEVTAESMLSCALYPAFSVMYTGANGPV